MFSNSYYTAVGIAPRILRQLVNWETQRLNNWNFLFFTVEAHAGLASCCRESSNKRSPWAKKRQTTRKTHTNTDPSQAKVDRGFERGGNWKEAEHKEVNRRARRMTAEEAGPTWASTVKKRKLQVFKRWVFKLTNCRSIVLCALEGRLTNTLDNQRTILVSKCFVLEHWHKTTSRQPHTHTRQPENKPCTEVLPKGASSLVESARARTAWRQQARRCGPACPRASCSTLPCSPAHHTEETVSTQLLSVKKRNCCKCSGA